MFLKVEIVTREHLPHRFARFRDFDGGHHEFELHIRSLNLDSPDAGIGCIDIGQPVGKRDDGAYLVQFSQESLSGATSAYVPLSGLVRTPVDAEISDLARLAIGDSWIGHTLCVVTIRGSSSPTGLAKTLEFTVRPDQISGEALLAAGPHAADNGRYLFTIDDQRGPLKVWVSADGVAAATSRSAALAEDGDIREHFKGGVYRVIARAAETVDYECLWPTVKRHGRSVAEFESVVVVDGVEVPRFAVRTSVHV